MRVFSVGFVLDVVAARRVAAAVFALSAAGALCLLDADGPLAAVGAFLFGFTAGAEYDLLAFMVSRYFPGSSQNAVLGASLSLVNAGAVLSPLLAGGPYTASGTCTPGLMLVVPGCLLASVLVTRLGPYPARPAGPPAP